MRSNEDSIVWEGSLTLIPDRYMVYGDWVIDTAHIHLGALLTIGTNTAAKNPEQKTQLLEIVAAALNKENYQYDVGLTIDHGHEDDGSIAVSGIGDFAKHSSNDIAASSITDDRNRDD
jgi:hypothetical protein